jgi:uncharacterized protein (TIGR02147 family)
MAKELSIFEYTEYKPYLRSKVGDKAARRGLKSALAKALSCQPTYISQVLNGHAHFSSEQVMDLNEFLGHSREEGHFFLLLVQKERAGKLSLRKYFQDQINTILDARMVLHKRLGAQTVLSEEAKVTFYSSWHYLAIQVALTIPHLQTKPAVAAHFQLPLKKVVQTIEFLMSIGLARQVGEHFESTGVWTRVESDSPHVARHHSQWRLQAMRSLDRADLEDLHYSAVVSLSRADIRALKSQMFDHIQEYVTQVKASKEEEVYGLCLDFFDLKTGL